jgi:carbon-monoxide dehydrogenase small subunit
MSYPVTMTVNRKKVTATVEPRWSLAEFLRDHLLLTGTHIGCDTSQCGACAVHVDGVGLKSCTLLAVQADGAEITTIEGLTDGGELHPMQAAFQDNHGLQCGFCTPGMIMSALDMVRRESILTDEIVRRNLAGNICRCTGYYNIVKAILSGARAMRLLDDSRAQLQDEQDVSV